MSNDIPTFEEAYPQPKPINAEDHIPTFEEAYGPSVAHKSDPAYQSYSVLGLGKNALSDVGRIGSGLANAVEGVGKTMYQEATGPSPILDPKGYAQNLMQTPVGQSVVNTPSNVVQGIGDFASDPIGAMYRNPVSTALTVYGGVESAKNLTGLFKNVPDLMDAGIKPKTLESMTPKGVNPADYAETLQKSLNDEGAIGKSPKETFDNMYQNTVKAGQDVGSARDAIAQAAGPDAVTVDAQTALKPIYDAWGKEVNAIVPDNSVLSKFSKYYNGLMDAAKTQGGRLTLDNIHSFLQEIGPKVHTGSEANQAIFSKLYSVGMEAQKGVVEAIAQQAGDDTLAKNLLDANARYSRNLRLMPDVSTNVTKAAIKEGMSAFQKYGGPTAMKYAEGGFVALTGEKLLEKLYHVITGE